MSFIDLPRIVDIENVKVIVTFSLKNVSLSYLTKLLELNNFVMVYYFLHKVHVFP